MYTVPITLKIHLQQLYDILTGAVECSIAYWMNEDSTNVDITRGVSGDVECVSFDNECTGTKQHYNITVNKILQAAQFIMSNNVNLSSEIKDTIAMLGTDDFDSCADAETYDALFQFACFNELVYG